MKKRNPLPSQEALHQLLDYERETGKLLWKPRGNPQFDNKYAGKEAFTSLYNGYRVGGILFRGNIGAHRVAFKWSYGIEPDEVDHINGDRADNRLINLRNVSSTENKRNSAIPRHNTSGVVGVAYRPEKRRWRASITLNNKAHHIGYFESMADAIEARKKFSALNNFHENHGRQS